MTIKFFESLGAKKHKGTTNRGGSMAVPAYFAYREDKNEKKSIVINLDKDIVKYLGWDVEGLRIDLYSTGKICGVSGTPSGRYALVKTAKDKNGVVNRYEIKMTWTPDICKEPLNRKSFPIDVKYHEEDGQRVMWFTFPEEIYMVQS
jgi:hypothetical protein